MMAKAIPQHGEVGFTLVELLVSLSIMALAALILAAGIGRLSLGNLLISRAEARIDSIQQAQFTLRHRIEQMQPLTDRQTGSTTDVAGQVDRLDFTGDAPDQAAPDALQRYRLALNGEGEVVLYRLSALDDRVDYRQKDTTGWEATPLLAGADGLSIGYFGPGPISAAPIWQNDWSHRPSLPLLVRISVHFPQGDQRVWPDLVIRPRAASSDTCKRDIRTGSCGGEI